VKVTAEAARRFLVARHLLAPARSLEGGPDAVLEVFRRFGSIQFDPLAVARSGMIAAPPLLPSLKWAVYLRLSDGRN
jgi:hypothetical protein